MKTERENIATHCDVGGVQGLPRLKSCEVSGLKSCEVSGGVTFVPA